MNNFLESLKKVNTFSAGEPVTEAQIEKAEFELDLFFANDYKLCLMNFGQVSAKNVELTSIINVKWLDVVKTTKEARERFMLPDKYYVLEDLHFDGALAVQEASGKVYIFHKGTLTEHSDSLLEYVITNSSK
ncbi:MAG: SMI1/KNR4 family protein [Clostridia bacterium]|nr:SMI1/KNR4 family protein [Clostridia bacterium]